MKTSTRLPGLPLAGCILAIAVVAVLARSGQAQTPANAAAPTHAAAATAGHAPASQAAVPARDLKRLGSIALLVHAADDPDHPIHNVSDFTIDDRGRFGFMLGCGCERKLVVVDRNGALIRLLELPKPPRESQSSRYAAWLGGDRWIVTSSSDEPGSGSSAIWVDMGSGKITPVNGFDTPQIQALASSGDGGFMALASIGTATGEQTYRVIAFDSKASVRWKSPTFASNDYYAYSRSITVTTSHNTVVLAGNTLRVYAVDGHLAHVVPIAGADNNDIHRFKGLRADTLGGVFVDDGGEHPTVLRVSIDGKSAGAFTPSFADGHPFELNGGVQRGPDGRLWTSDSYAFLQLDDHGRVVREVGDRYDPDHLENIADVTVNSNGWVFARDKRTHAIHVFDSAGRIDHVDKAMPGDNELLGSMKAGDAGDVYVTTMHESPGQPPGHQVIHYAADGKHTSIEPVISDHGERIGLSVIAQPGTGNHWLVQFDGIQLVDAHGKLLRRIDRNSDGDTLQISEGAAVAPDGSIAVAANVRQQGLLGLMPFGEPRTVVLLVSREGALLRTVPAPAGWEPWSDRLAFDGTRIAFVTRDPSSNEESRQSIVVTNAQGGAGYRFKPSTLDGDSKIFLLKRNGASELWIYNGKDAIDRYAVI